MKLKLTMLFLSFSFSLLSQIKVSNKKHTALIFEGNIESAIVSSPNYSFEYNEVKPSNIALIKALNTKVEETTLIVQTTNGVLFNLDVKYNPKSENIVNISDSLGVKLKGKEKYSTELERNIFSNIPLEEKKEIKGSIKENDYTIGNVVINDRINATIPCEFCQKVLQQKKGILKVLDIKYDVTIRFKNVFYNPDKLYFIVSIENKSNSNYHLNYIKSYISSGKDNVLATSQYLEVYPVQIYNSNGIIESKSERNFVFVYDLFTIDKNKSLVFEVNERNGERNLFLSVPNNIINNPRILK